MVELNESVVIFLGMSVAKRPVSSLQLVSPSVCFSMHFFSFLVFGNPCFCCPLSYPWPNPCSK